MAAGQRAAGAGEALYADAVLTDVQLADTETMAVGICMVVMCALVGVSAAAGIPTVTIGKDAKGAPVQLPMSGIGTWQYNDTVAEAAVALALTLALLLLEGICLDSFGQQSLQLLRPCLPLRRLATSRWTHPGTPFQVYRLAFGLRRAPQKCIRKVGRVRVERAHGWVCGASALDGWAQVWGCSEVRGRRVLEGL